MANKVQTEGKELASNTKKEGMEEVRKNFQRRMDELLEASRQVVTEFSQALDSKRYQKVLTSLKKEER